FIESQSPMESTPSGRLSDNVPHRLPTAMRFRCWARPPPNVGAWPTTKRGRRNRCSALRQLFEGPLGAGEKFSVVVALGDELGADRHAGRSLEDRDRDRRNVQRGPD